MSLYSSLSTVFYTKIFGRMQSVFLAFLQRCNHFSIGDVNPFFSDDQLAQSAGAVEYTDCISAER